MHKNRFTLIELLVCVAVIAILVAMLLPALSNVRMRSKRVVCMSNMKQTSIANMMYAGDSKGLFVPHVDDETKLAVGGAPIVTPWRTYLVRWEKGGTDRWWNLSNLYVQGYLPDPGVLYCLGQPLGSDGDFGDLSSSTTIIRMQRHYNPYQDAGGTEYSRLSKTPPEKIQMMDKVHEARSGTIHGVGFNVCRFDGSAKWLSSSTITAAAMAYGNTWPPMERLVTTLEEGE